MQDDNSIPVTSTPSDEVVFPDRREGDTERRGRAPEWFEDWKKARSDDAERLDRLETATERMAESAAGLNATLATFATKSQVEEVALSTQEQAEVHQRAVTAEMVEYRKRVLSRLYASGIVVGFVVLAVLAGAVNYAQGKSAAEDRYKSSLYQVCLARQVQSAAIREVLSQRPTEPQTPAQVAQTQKNAAILKEAFPPVDCGTLKP